MHMITSTCQVFFPFRVISFLPTYAPGSRHRGWIFQEIEEAVKGASYQLLGVSSGDMGLIPSGYLT